MLKSDRDTTSPWVDHRGNVVPDGVLERLAELATLSASSGGEPAAAIAVVLDELGFETRFEATTAEFSVPYSHAAHELVAAAFNSLLHGGECNVTVFVTHLPCDMCVSALAGIGVERVVSAGDTEPPFAAGQLSHTRLFGAPLALIDAAVGSAAKIAESHKAALEAEERLWDEGRVVLDTHPQVELHGVRVDEGVVDLLRVMHQHGVKTRYSCQGVQGGSSMAYVMFHDGASMDKAWKVLERLVERAGLPPLAARTYSSESIAEHRYDPQAWEVATWCYATRAGAELRSAVYMPVEECAVLNEIAKTL